LFWLHDQDEKAIIAPESRRDYFGIIGDDQISRFEN
jgi:hypothetical protein